MSLTKVSYSMIKGQYINALDYGAVGDGTTDDTTAIQAAVTAAAGIPVYFPQGTYRVTSTINCGPVAYDGAFGAPAKIIGDGPLKTYFDNQVNGPLFSLVTISSSVLFKGALGGVFEGFTIKRTVSTTNGVGIFFKSAYNLSINNVSIDGMTSHGIEIPVIFGDNDASNSPALQHVRIENCAGWGIKADGAEGNNELSFMYMRQVFVQACGTNAATYQPFSGGMIWKGQILKMDACAFTINENCALFILGQAGSANSVDLQSTTFENNKKRGLFCRGVDLFKGRNVQFYNNDGYTSTEMCEFEGNNFVIRNVDIDGVIVRASAGNNPITAFKISGAFAELNNCRVRNVSWQNFDYTGQTRFNGWQFDPIPTDGYILKIESSTLVIVKPNEYIGKGNKIPLRLRGGAGGVPSTTGEWIANVLPANGIGYNPATLPILANTRYYLYLYDNNGAPTLEESAAASQVTDATSGYAVKSNNATRYFVGSFLGGATNGTVATTGVGWLNPMTVPNGFTNTFATMWVDATGDVRIKSNGVLPTSDIDGTVVGTQT
jgi:hypothetical protein